MTYYFSRLKFVLILVDNVIFMFFDDESFSHQLNYMDPRISVAFCKRNEVPIEKIFSKTLRDKFNWAMAVPPDWLFNEEVGKQG